jgi:hypothetical protein
MNNQEKKLTVATLSIQELTMLRHAAENAIHAANPRYKPFIDAVANPLKILALIRMAECYVHPENLSISTH